MKAASFLLCLFLFSSVSFADDLDARVAKARADKMISEQATGYLMAVGSDPGVKALVEEVNKKRKEKYKAVAAETAGLKLETVEQAAGKQLMEKYK